MLKRRLSFNSGAGSDGGGTTEEENAFKQVSENVDRIITGLGEKAKQEEVDSLKQEIKALKDNLNEMKVSDVDKTLKSINEKQDSLWKQLIELQEKNAEGADKSTNVNVNTAFYTKEAVKTFTEKAISRSKDHNLLEIEETKTAETFGIPQSFVTGTGIDTGLAASGYQLVPGLIAKRRKTNIMLDFFNIPTIKVPYLIYLEKIEIGTGTAPNNGPGGASWIESGESKPQRSFRIQAVKADNKKLAIFGTIEDCLLQDIPSFDNWIRTDFIEQLDEVANNGLLRGNTSVNAKEPNGIITNASQYVVTPAFDETVLSANKIDAIIASASSMSHNSKYVAGVVFVSWDCYYNMISLKSSDERYLNNPLVYVDKLGTLYIAGVQVVPVDKDDIPSTHFLMIALDNGFKIFRYGSAGIETGLNGTDFREDKTSYRGWRRYITYFPANTRGSVIYDTFANVITLIEKPEQTP